MGPTASIFPQNKGWIINGTELFLSQLGISRITKILTPPTKPPNCEAAWEKRTGIKPTWKVVWGNLGTFLTSPKDEKTRWYLLQRAMYVCMYVKGRPRQPHQDQAHGPQADTPTIITRVTLAAKELRARRAGPFTHRHTRNFTWTPSI
jgi:hypothetical protein